MSTCVCARARAFLRACVRVCVRGLRQQLFSHAFALPLSLWGEIEENITDEIMVESCSVGT